MQTVANNLAQYNWFSSLDVQNAYHQVPILPEERLFTAFEANGQLYQFKRIPLGLKNAFPCFQRVVNESISKYNCKGTYAYLDDNTVCWQTREEHGENPKCFLNAAKRCNVTFNEKKIPTPLILSNCWATTFRTTCCSQIPTVSSLYWNCQWRTLARNANVVWECLRITLSGSLFFRKNKAVDCNEKVSHAWGGFSSFKDPESKTQVALKVIDEKLPFLLETGASDNAISATLNQEGRPMAFYSRAFKQMRVTSVKFRKGGLCAIVDAIRKWAHLLGGRPFTVDGSTVRIFNVRCASLQ